MKMSDQHVNTEEALNYEKQEKKQLPRTIIMSWSSVICTFVYPLRNVVLPWCVLFVLPSHTFKNRFQVLHARTTNTHTDTPR